MKGSGIRVKGLPVGQELEVQALGLKCAVVYAKGWKSI